MSETKHINKEHPSGTSSAHRNEIGFLADIKCYYSNKMQFRSNKTIINKSYSERIRFNNNSSNSNGNGNDNGNNNTTTITTRCGDVPF